MALFKGSRPESNRTPQILPLGHHLQLHSPLIYLSDSCTARLTRGLHILLGTHEHVIQLLVQSLKLEPEATPCIRLHTCQNKFETKNAYICATKVNPSGLCDSVDLKLLTNYLPLGCT